LKIAEKTILGTPKRIEALLAWIATAIVPLRVIGQFICTEVIGKAL
jgi:hypothetical protein